MKLVDQFADFADANPQVKFKAATVAVHGGATSGSHSWVKLGKSVASSRDDIEADITAATMKDPGSGTHFLKGFVMVDKMFESEGASATEKKQRNYVIFLTDGQANGPGDTMAAIPARMTELVTKYGLAVDSIMITKPAKKAGIDSEKLMKSLALPTTGDVGKDHVGTYVNAVDASAIGKAFEDFYKKITTCD